MNIYLFESYVQETKERENVGVIAENYKKAEELMIKVIKENQLFSFINVIPLKGISEKAVEMMFPIVKD